MSAQVIPLAAPTPSGADWESLVAVTELHALICIDRVEGSSPVRVYFVMNPRGKREVAARLGRAEVARAPDAYALVAYDFPFALLQLKMAECRMAEARAREIVAYSASLQQDSLVRAALAMGFRAAPAVAFDAEGLKAVFFPHTQESIIGVVRLSRASA